MRSIVWGFAATLYLIDVVLTGGTVLFALLLSFAEHEQDSIFMAYLLGLLTAYGTAPAFLGAGLMMCLEKQDRRWVWPLWPPLVILTGAVLIAWSVHQRHPLVLQRY